MWVSSFLASGSGRAWLVVTAAVLGSACGGGGGGAPSGQDLQLTWRAAEDVSGGAVAYVSYSEFPGSSMTWSSWDIRVPAGQTTIILESPDAGTYAVCVSLLSDDGAEGPCSEVLTREVP